MNEKTVPIPLSKGDIQNLIALGNRAQMSGVEADMWVELKRRLAQSYELGLEELARGPVPVNDDAA